MKVFGYIENPTENQVLKATRICIKENRNRAKRNLFAIPIADGGKSILLMCWQPSSLVDFNQEIFDYYFPQKEDKIKALKDFSKLTPHQIQLDNGKLSEKDILIIRELDRNPFDFFQEEISKMGNWKPFKQGLEMDNCFGMMLFALKSIQPIKNNQSIFHEKPTINGSRIIFEHYQTELMFVRDDKPHQFYYLLKPSQAFLLKIGKEFTLNETANLFRIFRCDTKINQIVEVPLIRVKLCQKCGNPIHVKCTIGDIQFKMHPEINGEEESIFHGFFENLGNKNRFTIIPVFETSGSNHK